MIFQFYHVALSLYSKLIATIIIFWHLKIFWFNKQKKHTHSCCTRAYQITLY